MRIMSAALRNEAGRAGEKLSWIPIPDCMPVLRFKSASVRDRIRMRNFDDARRRSAIGTHAGSRSGKEQIPRPRIIWRAVDAGRVVEGKGKYANIPRCNLLSYALALLALTKGK